MPPNHPLPAPPILPELLRAIDRSRSFCLVSHLRPDGDCLGSQLALGAALRALDRSVELWNVDPVPRKLAFLDPHHSIQTPRPGRSFDCVIATDTASLDRLGDAANHLGRPRHFLNIDHHESNTRFAHLNWVDPTAPATGELIHQLFHFARWPITPPIADCLFTAISTDTGSFQYASVRPETFDIAADLLRQGARLADLSREIYQSRTAAQVQLLRHTYSHLRLSRDARLAWLWLRPDHLDRFHADRADTEGLIDHLRALDSVIVACLFEQTPRDGVRLSLRSKSPAIDVNRIAARFGGGGHPAAAGARISGSPASVQRRVLHALRQALTASDHAHSQP